MSDLIINQPKLQTLRQRYTFSFLTFVFWAVWLYLWLPLVSLFAWALGVDLFYEQMIVQSGYQAFLDLVGWYFLVIVLIAIVLSGWALYNLLRFRNQRRRIGGSAVSTDEIARHFGVEPEQLTQWHGARRLVVRVDESGVTRGADAVENAPIARP